MKNKSTLAPLSGQSKKLYDAAIHIMQGDQIELGFICRTMVSASMPHSKVRGSQYKRQNNLFTLTIIGNDESGGIPYGVYPRLIMSWLITEVVKTRSREVVLGQSLSDFMKKLGLSVSGGQWGTISRLKAQLKRLFASHISCTYQDTKLGKWINTNMNIADKAQIFWDPNNPEQLDLFKSTITLGEGFYNEIIRAPIPIDITAINALKDSSLALDIYFWLTYRLNYLKTPVLIPFEKLLLQFGGGYSDTSHGHYEFKRKFLHQLQKVLFLYPEIKIELQDNNLRISPIRSSIKKMKTGTDRKS